MPGSLEVSKYFQKPTGNAESQAFGHNGCRGLVQVQQKHQLFVFGIGGISVMTEEANTICQGMIGQHLKLEKGFFMLKESLL